MPFRDRLARARHRVLGAELDALRDAQRRLEEQQQALRVALGALMAHEIAGSASSCNEAEFRSFSQFGEDGIIEYLVRRCDLSPTTFVEIGVETYQEANTRFLAEHRQWRGLIVDQNPRLARDLAHTRLDWRAQVASASSFVTRENVRGIVEPFIGSAGLGLLSVDIDGVDYWVLEELVGFEPAAIIVEYNALFGDTAAVSIPYDARFDRSRPEFHGIYYGASLGAFVHLLGGRGYCLVACGTAGNNAFFVRSDRLGEVAPVTVADGYRPRRFVEHRATDGSLTGLTSPSGQLASIRGLPLVDVTDGRTGTVAELLNP